MTSGVNDFLTWVLLEAAPDGPQQDLWHVSLDLPNMQHFSKTNNLFSFKYYSLKKGWQKIHIWLLQMLHIYFMSTFSSMMVNLSNFFPPLSPSQ